MARREDEINREAVFQDLQDRRARLQADASQQSGADVIQAVDRGPEVVATSLAPQLGSDSSMLAKGAVDMRRFSIISEQDIVFLIYAKVRSRKSRIWALIYDEFLNLQVGVDGRGRRDIIRMEGVSKGGMPDLEPELQQPGWFARNVTRRNWRKEAVRDQM